MNEPKSPLSVMAAAALVLSIGCIVIFLLSIWHQQQPVPWTPGDSLTWDGLTAMFSTLLSAGIAGYVASWVLDRQNRAQGELQRNANAHQGELQRNANAHQGELQRDALETQQEEARKAREIQAAADLAEHIDMKWHLFRDVFDVQENLGSTEIPVEEIRHLRRLTNIWTSHLRDDLIERARVDREDIRKAILKYAEALEWGGLHHDYEPISSEARDGELHDPWRQAWRGQIELATFSHDITEMATLPDERAVWWWESLVDQGKAHGQFMFHVRQKPRPMLGRND